MKLGLERLLHLKDKFTKKNLARVVASVVLPFMINSSAKGVLLTGSVTHSISPGLSFTVAYTVDGKEGPEDDSIYGGGIPSPGHGWVDGKMTTFVDGVEVKGMRVPASSSPGSGICPSMKMIIGAGATYIVAPGRTWTSTASVSGFDQVDETGGHWTYKVTDSAGEIPAGTYVGPTSFSYGSGASIEWTYIPGTTKPPVDPNEPDPTPTPTPITPTKPVNNLASIAKYALKWWSFPDDTILAQWRVPEFSNGNMVYAFSHNSNSTEGADIGSLYGICLAG